MNDVNQDKDEEFRTQVAFTWNRFGSPVSFIGWDAEKCKRLMPAFYEAWEKVAVYKKLADLAAANGE